MKKYFTPLFDGPLDSCATAEIFSSMMADGSEAATDAQIGAYLFAMARRLPTAEELAAAASSLRAHMVAVPLKASPLLDTAGTGGSGLTTFNASTVAALICAAAGQKVAKHGNRAATSACGSADLLEALGIRIELDLRGVERCFAETGFCFMFAPAHHPATRRVVRIRRELGFRTIFNFLGPLCNPAGAGRQVIGVSELSMAGVMAEALSRLGTERSLVVRGEDGLDEISLCAPTKVFEVVPGEAVKEYTISPEEAGLKRREFAEICGGNPADSAKRVRALLAGKAEAYADFACLNAGAALYVCGRATSIKEGVRLAADCVRSGAPAALLEKLVTVSNS